MDGGQDRCFLARGRRVAAAALCSFAACASPSPTVRIEVTPAGQAIAGVTRMSFTARAADLPPGAMYEWTFGDGGTATGPVVSHVFPGEGAFVVAVTARAGSRSAESTLAVTARSLTAVWSRPGGPAGFDFYFDLVQRGPVLCGAWWRIRGRSAGRSPAPAYSNSPASSPRT